LRSDWTIPEVLTVWLWLKKWVKSKK
jgi:hypothetical protein